MRPEDNRSGVMYGVACVGDFGREWYKPVSGLALLFPSADSGMKRTQRETN